MNKRILIVVNHFIVVYNFRRELIERLIRDGYAVSVVVPDDDRNYLLEELGCEIINVQVDRRGTNILSDLKLLLEYHRVIKRLKPTMVFTYTIKPNIYGGIASMINNVRYVANITGLGTAVENAGFFQKLSVFLYKIATRKIKSIFFQNEENMQFFVDNKIALGRHHLIPGSGVNLSHFKPLPYPSEETVEFVFISRIMKEKGIDQYLEMARVIKKKYPHTRFHICGFCEKDYSERIDELFNNGIVEYHGVLADVRTLLSRTHCTVHPTYYPEGLSNVLLESAATARPLISTDRSGCREVIDNGINGYLVTPCDAADLIEKVEMFIVLSYEEKKKMGEFGYRKVKEQYDRQIVVNAYLNEI